MEKIENATVDQIVGEILALQDRVSSPFDALYQTPSLPTGEEIRAIREGLGLTQKEVTENTQVSRSQLSDYKTITAG